MSGFTLTTRSTRTHMRRPLSARNAVPLFEPTFNKRLDVGRRNTHGASDLAAARTSVASFRSAAFTSGPSPSATIRPRGMVYLIAIASAHSCCGGRTSIAAHRLPFASDRDGPEVNALTVAADDHRVFRRRRLRQGLDECRADHCIARPSSYRLDGLDGQVATVVS